MQMFGCSLQSGMTPDYSELPGSDIALKLLRHPGEIKEQNHWRDKRRNACSTIELL